jgi:hypothetical protein
MIKIILKKNDDKIDVRKTKQIILRAKTKPQGEDQDGDRDRAADLLS